MSAGEFEMISEVPQTDLRSVAVKGARDRASEALSPVAMEDSRSAMAQWAELPLAKRLGVLAKARRAMAAAAERFAEAISPDLARSQADTLAAEVLPLLDACRFLEREAPRLLKPRRLGRRGRPFWLSGVVAEVRREPLGRVLVIGPANFPLFLAGVQTLQALAAGNAVIWKPGAGGEAVARLFAKFLEAAGLPSGVLAVTGEDVAFAKQAIAAGPNKVVFTGGSYTGRKLLEQLAPLLIPATLELSGTDAAIVLESADLRRVAQAVAFALRLNGGHVCMSPRRLIATAKTLNALRPLLMAELDKVPSVALTSDVADQLSVALGAAEREGAQILGRIDSAAQRPLLLAGATPSMHITRSSFFAPVLALIESPSDRESPRLHNENPYGLGASIFGDESTARVLATHLKAGSVFINDIVAPTADPRIPFGGRGESGYGVTRGAEGLLDMTAVKVVQVRRNRFTRHYEQTTHADVPLFAGIIRVAHGAGWRQRLSAFAEVAGAARTRKTSSNQGEPR